uniref:F-box domain-containing protein n=1 Tax=Quercus lobata TaxID=97700 RepID=A0A7N2MD30_QUELO
MDIFSRLPITTILQCKSVCKTWFNIISDPYFTKLHHARAPVSLILRASGNFFSRWYVLALEGWDKHDSFVPLKQLPREISHLGEALQFETWCNGLLCISAYCPKNSVTNYVLNVITGEYMSLPKPGPKSDGFKRTIRGFGFSQATKRYKVIQEIYEDRKPLATHQHHHTSHSQLEPYNNSTFICHFDIENEQLKPFPGPPVQDFSQVEKMNLGVSGGFLYLSENLLTSCSVEIWVMKDYGIKKSWTKEFVIPDTQCLYAYNARGYNEHQLEVRGISTSYSMYPFVPSLVSLKEAVIGESSQEERKERSKSKSHSAMAELKKREKNKQGHSANES